MEKVVDSCRTRVKIEHNSQDKLLNKHDNLNCLCLFQHVINLITLLLCDMDTHTHASTQSHSEAVTTTGGTSYIWWLKIFKTNLKSNPERTHKFAHTNNDTVAHTHTCERALGGHRVRVTNVVHTHTRTGLCRLSSSYSLIIYSISRVFYTVAANFNKK